MDLQEQLARDLKDAMRAKDQTRLLTIRAIRSAIIEKEKDPLFKHHEHKDLLLELGARSIEELGSKSDQEEQEA